MKALRDFLIGLVLALAVPAAVIGLLLMTGCASGIRVTDEEAIACRDQGCTVWTDGEVRALVRRAGTAGYLKGWTDSNNQAGRGL